MMPNDPACMANPDDRAYREDMRYALLHIEPATLVAIIRGIARITNLPADAVLLRWAMPIQYHSIAIVVHSASFEPVPHGQALPNMWATYVWLTAEELAARTPPSG